MDVYEVVISPDNVPTVFDIVISPNDVYEVVISPDIAGSIIEIIDPNTFRVDDEHTSFARAYSNIKTQELVDAKVNISLLGAAGGIALLDSNTKIPLAYLPAAVENQSVRPFATLSVFPAIGVEGIIYIATTTNELYRWDGIDYVYLVAGLNDVTDLAYTPGSLVGPIINSSTGADVTLPSASATESGVMTTGAQSIAGVKTFTSPILITPSIGVATGTSISLSGGEDAGISVNGTNILNEIKMMQFALMGV